jgi:hypothetical protein
MSNSNPLESLSEVYASTQNPQDHKYWNDRIIDDPKNEILYVVPAGFTYPTDTGESRLYYYKSLWEKSVSYNREKVLFPLGKDTHSIILEKDTENKYDPYAVKIKIKFNLDYGKEYIPKKFEAYIPQEIGFIPQVISEMICTNIKMIKRGSLANVYAELPKGIYFGRIALFYGKEEKTTPDIDYNSKRFIAILEE